ncbi:MAG: hypothetical protein Alis3KO_25770 [Aliiglaciecola sp.]
MDNTSANSFEYLDSPDISLFLLPQIETADSKVGNFNWIKTDINIKSELFIILPSDSDLMSTLSGIDTIKSAQLSIIFLDWEQCHQNVENFPWCLSNSRFSAVLSSVIENENIKIKDLINRLEINQMADLVVSTGNGRIGSSDSSRQFESNYLNENSASLILSNKDDFALIDSVLNDKVMRESAKVWRTPVFLIEKALKESGKHFVLDHDFWKKYLLLGGECIVDGQSNNIVNKVIGKSDTSLLSDQVLEIAGVPELKLDSRDLLLPSNKINRSHKLVEELLSQLGKPLLLLNTFSLCFVQEINRLTYGRQFNRLVDYILVNQFGIKKGFYERIKMKVLNERSNVANVVNNIISLTAEFIDNVDINLVREDHLKNYWFFILELQGLGDETGALLLAAKVSRLMGLQDKENLFLQQCVKKDEKQFWQRFEEVYRFSLPFPKLLNKLEMDECRFSAETFKRHKKVYFFPDYSNANSYQTEVYRSSINEGVDVQGIRHFEELAELTNANTPGLVHIHWINAIFEKVEEKDKALRNDSFFTLINELQSKGWEIFWTVHNRYSHSSLGIEFEDKFRHRLSSIVDKVILHHPCIKYNIEQWLSSEARVEFMEHGSYQVDSLSLKRETAKDSFGFEKNDMVLGIFGKIKPYKLLDRVLHHLLPILKDNPRIKVIVAGEQMCEKAKKSIPLLPKNQVLIDNTFVDNEQLSKYYQASDFVILSYKDILTSGSLFQSFSFGRPVIAPKLGTIPNYVIDDYNGYLYDTDDDIPKILKCIDKLQESSIDILCENALHASSTLTWP